MTDDRMTLIEQIQKSTDGDFLRTVAEHTRHRLMAFEVDALIGAGRHERSEERTTYRNGTRSRHLETRLGRLDLKIPKLRQGSYFPAFLERPLAGDWPYVWLDATCIKVRQDGRIVSIAAIIATGVNQDGRREILGLGLGQSEAATFWIEFLRSLLCHVPKDQQTVVSAAVHQVFIQPDRKAPGEAWRHVADQLRPRFRKVAALLDDAEHDVLAYMDFPEAHRTKLHSTNPIERLNREVKRRTDVVGIFPNENSVQRLVGAILLEQNDDWLLQHRDLTLETMAGVASGAETAITVLPPAKAA